MTKILMPIFIDLIGVLSFGRLRWRTPMDDMLRDCRSDGIRSRATMFFLTIWFQMEQCEALQYVAIAGHVFSPMVKSVTENGMEDKI
jgi:hypothetical protein